MQYKRLWALLAQLLHLLMSGASTTSVVLCWNYIIVEMESWKQDHKLNLDTEG